MPKLAVTPMFSHKPSFPASKFSTPGLRSKGEFILESQRPIFLQLRVLRRELKERLLLPQPHIKKLCPVNIAIIVQVLRVQGANLQRSRDKVCIKCGVKRYSSKVTVNEGLKFHFNLSK